MPDIATTPMLKQYLEIKSRHKDCILFFRLGDFYEMFFEDAQDASAILDLVLTSRGHDGTGKIPMCGIPFHAADNYIARLVKAGRKVAVCEQVEDPAAAKGIVKRDVIRVISAGTFVDDTADPRYIVSVYPAGKSFGLAFTDNTSGTVFTNRVTSINELCEIVAKLPVCECLFPESQKELITKQLRFTNGNGKMTALTAFRDWSFAPDRGRTTLTEHFGTQSLRGFGIEDTPEAQAASGALIEYLKEMNKRPLRHIDRLAVYEESDFVFISPAAHHGLELEMLLKTLDRTTTAMGRRLFRFWLYHPLKNSAVIRQRQEAVTLLKANPEILQTLVETHLKGLPDLEKSLSRLSCGIATPRDFLILRQALIRAPAIAGCVEGFSRTNPLFTVEDLPFLRDELERAIDPDMPLAKNEGKVIRKGYNAELDELRGLQENGRAWLVDFQAREAKRTGISSLKVGFNRVFGYFLEITNANLKAVPADYIRRQTLANGERFITEELKAYEEKILSAESRVLKIEQLLLAELERKILNDIRELQIYAAQLAHLDVLCGLAVLAGHKNYVCPEITTDTDLIIEEGRHPVVESLMPTEDFIPNDTRLNCSDQHLIVLTGPNMAGKSTWIRQTAVLVIMAQMGSYIPASVARIGIVDKIFTRIGAHDEIARGQSTFMVEMTETADLLNNLSPRSLVILDEIGRGTSTYDGLSLAWALAEHLAGKKVRALFATHFHELTLLADQFAGVRNFNVAVREWEDQVIFLHKIIPGGTDDSYGIYVAKLAGMPGSVVRRAKQILSELELSGNLKDRLKARVGSESQIDLFSAGPDPVLEEIRKTLESLDLNNLTPVQALKKLEEMKSHLSDN